MEQQGQLDHPGIATTGRDRMVHPATRVNKDTRELQVKKAMLENQE